MRCDARHDPLLPGKPRRPLLQERGHTLRVIGRRAGHALAQRLVLQRLVQRHGPAPFEGLLGQCQRLRREASEPAGDRTRLRCQRLLEIIAPSLLLQPFRDHRHDAFRRAIHAHDFAPGALTAEVVAGGKSNLTYIVRAGDTEFVVRRPPLGHVLATAHDMAREFRVLTAFHDAPGWHAHAPVPVPVPIALCADPDVIGAPFYVMEEVKGDVITHKLPAPLDNPEQRARVAEELIDALVELHAVDWTTIGLEGFGKPTGYLERQLRRFNGLWEHNRTREIPEFEQVSAWLAENELD